MSDEKAAINVADSTDAEFQALLDEESAKEAAGISDNNDELNVQPVEDKEQPVVETSEEEAKPTETDTEDPGKETEVKGDPKNPEHDIHATLKEEDDPAKPKEPAKDTEAKQDDKSPRFVKDAKNLAAKWEDLSDEKKLEKVTKLAKNRPHTFKALATELGTSPELLLEQHELDSTDLSDAGDLPPEIDVEKIRKEAEASALEKFRAEQAGNTDKAESERNRFVTEVSDFAKHNKFDDETTKKITDFNGDLFKKFNGIKYDPETGKELSMKGRLKLALSGDDSIKEALVKSGVMHQSKRVIAGVQQALPKAGKPGKVASKEHTDIANADDKDFSKAMETVSNNGVVPIEL